MKKIELIDKKEIIKKLKGYYRECEKDAKEMGGEAVILAEGISDAIDIVSDEPVVKDIEPVVHGRWIIRGGNFRCSICDGKAKWDCFGGTGGFSREFEQAKTIHCPNCGAKMDLESKNEKEKSK